MRTKEEAQDYRYFPEPDLPLFVIAQQKIDQIMAGIPELPREKTSRFISEFGLSEYDAGVLVFSSKYADYAEECMRAYPDKNKKPIINWLIGPVLAQVGSRGFDSLSVVKPEALIELVQSVEKQEISLLSAKNVFTQMLETGMKSSQIIKSSDLTQISDTKQLDALAEEAISENPKSASDYRQGKAGAVMFLVGQVMKKSKGKANPKLIQEILKRRLDNA